MGAVPDQPQWGPATTYRSQPQLKRGQAAARPAAGGAASSRSVGARTGKVPVVPAVRSGAPRSAQARPAGRSGGSGGQPPRRPTGARPAPGGGMSASRRRGLIRLGVLVLVLAVVAYPVLLGVTGYRAVDRFGALPESSLPDTPGRTVLLVGSDSREGLSRDQRVELSTGDDVEGKRTDTIMLLHRPSGGGPTVLLSIPRDSYVDIPGHDSSKINAAYAWGGPALLAQTVEAATGLRVDGYAETGLSGFANVVDAVGGVTMCPENAIVDPLAGLDIPAGCQEMGGPTALGYARTRHEDASGDLGRAQRQRELISAIAAKAASPATLVNPFRALPMARAGGGALTVDDDFGPFDLAGFARAMRAVSGDGAVSLTVPVADTTRRTNAGVVVDWDTEQAEAVFEALRSDDTEAVRAIAQAQLPG